LEEVVQRLLAVQRVSEEMLVSHQVDCVYRLLAVVVAEQDQILHQVVQEDPEDLVVAEVVVVHQESQLEQEIHPLQVPLKVMMVEQRDLQVQMLKRAVEAVP